MSMEKFRAVFAPVDDDAPEPPEPTNAELLKEYCRNARKNGEEIPTVLPPELIGLFDARPDPRKSGMYRATCPRCDKKDALVLTSTQLPECAWGCYPDMIINEQDIDKETYYGILFNGLLDAECESDADSRPRLRSFTPAELRARPIQQRELIVSPFMGKYESQFIYGPKGEGKTWVAMGCAIIAAQGGGARFLNFRADGPGVPTIFFDGEMFERDLRARFEDICRTANLDPGDNLHFWTPDMQDAGTPPLDLLTEQGRQMVFDHIDDVEQKIGRRVEQTFKDNLSTLLANWDENSGVAFDPMAKFTLALRARRVGSTWVHHSNKQGFYSGHTAIIRAMHAIVNVRHPKGYRPGMGAFFDLSYEYTRARPVGLIDFNARLEGDAWTTTATATAVKEADREAAILGILREVAGDGISRKDLRAQLQKEGKGMGNETFLTLVKRLIGVQKVKESDGLLFDSEPPESGSGK